MTEFGAVSTDGGPPMTPFACGEGRSGGPSPAAGSYGAPVTCWGVSETFTVRGSTSIGDRSVIRIDSDMSGPRSKRPGENVSC